MKEDTCAYCGRRRKDVPALIRGPRVDLNICSVCVRDCHEVIEAGMDTDDPLGAPAIDIGGSMDCNEYQKGAGTTAMYPGKGKILGLLYVALGLAGEAGEVANKTKKVLRDDDQVLTEERREQLKGELGDVLWYLAQCATELGTDLSTIAEDNLRKLKERKEKGLIQGEGDNRA